MQVVLVGTVIMVATVVVSLVGLRGVRRRVPHQVMVPHNNVAGIVYSTIGITFAVVLGFMVIAVWQQFRDAQAHADSEANAAADIARLSAWFPAADTEAVRGAVRAYVESVVADEWPAMAREEAPAPATDALLDELWATYRRAGEGSAAAAPVQQNGHPAGDVGGAAHASPRHA